MAELPELTVLVCTYERPAELLQTVEAHKQFLQYPENKLRWLICDDHTSKGYTKITSSKLLKSLGAKIVRTEKNGGWGINVNNGLSNADTDFVYFTEDDYVPTTPIPLDVATAVMLTKTDLGMIRFRGTAGSHIVYHGFETDIRDYLPDYQSGTGAVPGKITYLQLDSGSPDLYLYSNGPHLKHRRFHDFYGLYPTGIKLGQTEEFYAHTVKDKMKEGGAPAIAILPEWVNMRYDHIGQSYQHTAEDD